MHYWGTKPETVSSSNGKDALTFNRISRKNGAEVWVAENRDVTYRIEGHHGSGWVLFRDNEKWTSHPGTARSLMSTAADVAQGHEGTPYVGREANPRGSNARSVVSGAKRRVLK